jgi:CRISPR system Cascade subunit CasA
MTIIEDWTGGKQMATFRLDREPWIPVVHSTGTEAEVNLVDVFDQAASIRSLSGTPLEVAAILRLLLAISHLTETPANLARWGELWQDRAVFMKRCAAYVRDQGEVWDLFHSSRPFLQDKRLTVLTGEPVEPTFLSRGKVGADAFVSHMSAADIALLTPA